jgi:catechol-2,3-dioxygenase
MEPAAIDHLVPAVRELAVHGMPVERTGAQGRLQPVYVRDPDGNPIELPNPH